MSPLEFSQAFDARIDAFNEVSIYGEQDKRLSFDEYEKSMYLTKAQDELILYCYTGKSTLFEGFEATEEIRRYLTPLLDGTNYSLATSITGHHEISLPDEVWFIVYEDITVSNTEGNCPKNGKVITVVPTTHDELPKILNNPFRGPNKNRALRVDKEGNTLDIIFKENPTNTVSYHYNVRYITAPTPIITDTLPPHIDIRGKHDISECLLHEALHEVILDRAVQLAVSAKALNSPKNQSN